MNHRLIIALTLACLSTLSLGCESIQSRSAAAFTRGTLQPHVDAGPITDQLGFHRSYATDSITLSLITPEAKSSRFIYRNAQPWYNTRNDYRPATRAGFRTAIYESATNTTYDRRYSTHNNIYNHYHNTQRLRQTYRVIR
ncbi:hypothetical protein [Poriferisphaera sp. WC338]|uniref:hypothetical protein n=1 Tax=Poriferisphaera sp. WC338 TaxID=3425129 RepID=UPI003D816601